MKIENWNIQNITGYVPKTTFYEDFSIAERFGVSAIKDTYNRAFNEWKTNVEYITELVMALNWKLWRWYEQNSDFTDVYNDLYLKADNWCINNLEGDDLMYYYRTTD